MRLENAGKKIFAQTCVDEAVSVGHIREGLQLLFVFGRFFTKALCIQDTYLLLSSVGD